MNFKLSALFPVIALCTTSMNAAVTQYKVTDEATLRTQVDQIIQGKNVDDIAIAFDFDDTLRFKKRKDFLRNGTGTHEMLGDYRSKNLDMLILTARNKGLPIPTEASKPRLIRKYQEHQEAFAMSYNGKPLDFKDISPFKEAYSQAQISLPGTELVAITNNGIVMAGGDRQAKARTIAVMIDQNMFIRQKKIIIIIDDSDKNIQGFVDIFADRPEDVHAIHYPLPKNTTQHTITSFDEFVTQIKTIAVENPVRSIILSIDFNDTLYVKDGLSGGHLREGIKTLTAIEELRAMGIDMYISTAKMKGAALRREQPGHKKNQKFIERLDKIKRTHFDRTLGFETISPFKEAFWASEFNTQRPGKKTKQLTVIIRNGVAFAGGDKTSKSLAVEHMLDNDYFTQEKTIIIAIDNKDKFLKEMTQRFKSRTEQLHTFYFPMPEYIQ